jgi:hypothetical protein
LTLLEELLQPLLEQELQTCRWFYLNKDQLLEHIHLDQTLQNFKLTLALAAAEAAEAETDQALKDNREDLEDLVSMLDLLQAEQVIVLLPEEQETEDQELQDLEVQEMQVEIQTLQI